MSTEPGRPIRVLVLRGVDGSGGGADKIILRNAVAIDTDQFQMQLCFMRHEEDREYDFDIRAKNLGVNYCEVLHRGPLDRRVKPGIKRIVKEFQPDIVHSHDYKANFFNWKIAKQANYKTLATSHGWTGHGFRERYIYYPADQRILSSFDQVIAVSDNIRDTLLSRGAKSDRVQVVLNGVNPDDYRFDERTRKEVRTELGLTDDQVVLGAVGRVETQKRFDVLLEAMDVILKKRSNVVLLIAGEGSLSRQISDLILKMNLSDHCKMLGHCSDMKKTYHAFDMLVQSSDYEGTPTVVVEAMAMGIPVVATDAGGTSQLMTDQEHGLIVPCRSPRELANAVDVTLKDADATRKRVQSAIERVKNDLSFQNRIQTLQAIYSSLVGKRS